MMSDEAAKHHALYLANVILAESIDELLPVSRGWSCVIRFYAALHLMNAYLVDKRNIVFDPVATEHKERAYAMARSPELRDAPARYRQLKALSESVRYDVNYAYADEDRLAAIAWLAKTAAIVEPKLKKR
jgi:hypothetical protein